VASSDAARRRPVQSVQLILSRSAWHEFLLEQSQDPDRCWPTGVEGTCFETGNSHQRDARETRVAILEDDRLVELLVDRPGRRRMVGDIYLGTVEAVLPGYRPRSSTSGRKKAPFSTPPT